MAEFIVRETGYPGAVTQEVVGELVRCKDCRHWRKGYVFSYCQKLLNMGALDVYDFLREEDDFCSYAERWEEGDPE